VPATACRVMPVARAEDALSDRGGEIEALNNLLCEARADLERATDEDERRTLVRYCAYLEARLARLQEEPSAET
jgi:hypothetical protein